MKIIYQGLQTRHMYRNTKKGLDANILVQIIFKVFQEVNFLVNLSNQLSIINYRWAWITCYSRSNKESPSIRFRHGYFTITYFTCSTMLRCFMFQTIQNCIHKRKTRPW